MSNATETSAQDTRTPQGYCECCHKRAKVQDYGIFAPSWLCWTCAVHRTQRKACPKGGK